MTLADVGALNQNRKDILLVKLTDSSRENTLAAKLGFSTEIILLTTPS